MELPVDLTTWICSLSTATLPSSVRMELTNEIATRGLDSKKFDYIVRSRERPSWAEDIGITEATMAMIRRVWVAEFCSTSSPEPGTSSTGFKKDESEQGAEPSPNGSGSGSGTGRNARFPRPPVPDLHLPDERECDPSRREYDITLGDWKWDTNVALRPNGKPAGFAQASAADRDRITAFYRFQGLPDVSSGLVTNEICPRVFCGPMADAAYLPLLNSLKINYILNLAHEVRYAEELRPHEKALITYFHLPIHDTIDQVKLLLQEPDFVTLRKATGFIHKTLASDPTASVLVHCVQGLSRAPTTVAAYMMEYLGYSLDQAVYQIRQAHEGAFLPFRFEEILRLFEKSRFVNRSNVGP